MKKVTAALLLLLLISAAVLAQSTREQQIADLETKLETVSGKERVDVLNELASYLYTRAPKECIQRSNEALELSDLRNYPKGRARALVYKSLALSVRGEREKVLEHGKEALSIYETLGDRPGVAFASNALGYFYLQMDYYNIALEYFLGTLKIFEALGKKKDIVTVLWNLGNLYINLKDYQKALDYFQNALVLLEEKNDDLRARFFHNIALAHRGMGDFNKSREYFHRALKVFQTAGNRFWLASTLDNIGETLAQMGQNQPALEYLLKAQQINKDLGRKSGIYFNAQSMGDVYAQIKDYNRALFYYDQSLAIASELEDNSQLEPLYKKYSDLYAVKSDYKKALEFHRLYTKAKDALLDAAKNRQIAEMQEKYDTEKRTAEIQLLKKDNRIQKITRNALVAVVVLAMVIIVLLFKKYLYLFAFWKKQKYIGRYRVTEVIGSGGMGVVYHAHGIRDKTETAAVKVLNEEFSQDPETRKRFKREGAIIDSLDHPNIVNVYERGEYKDRLYIAMEYLHGNTLELVIREAGKLDLDLCVRVMMQAADAMAFIHEKGIVHRDLKPSNIMLVRDEDRPSDSFVVKLLDFGLARSRYQSRLTRTGVLVGTVSYMSPEQISGQPVTTAGDVYALGIVFYEMLTGRHAFPGDTITDIADKILASTPAEPGRIRPEIPDALNRLVVQMLAKEPGRRPSATSVRDTLNNEVLNDVE